MNVHESAFSFLVMLHHLFFCQPLEIYSDKNANLTGIMCESGAKALSKIARGTGRILS